MRKVTLFAAAFLAFILVLTAVSAVNSCTDNQRIMKLTGITNAHASLYNIGTYAVDVCFADVFGRDYTGATQHPACTPANQILRLVANTNAHAELSSYNNLNVLGNYSIPVCYGDLVCRNTMTSCNSNERVVVSLSSLTNAHVSLDSIYPQKICCSSANAQVCNHNGVCDGLENPTTCPSDCGSNGLTITGITTIPSFPINNNGSAQNVTVFFASNVFPINVTFNLYNGTGLVNTQGPTQLNNSADFPLIYTIPANLPDGQYSLNMTVKDSLDNTVTVVLGNIVVNKTSPVQPVCGNGIVEAGEVCDGANFVGDSCTAHNYNGGSLTCMNSCSLVSYSSCTSNGGDSSKPSGGGSDDGSHESRGGSTITSIGGDTGSKLTTTGTSGQEENITLGTGKKASTLFSMSLSSWLFWILLVIVILIILIVLVSLLRRN